MNYYAKYMKYKTKYNNLKGGAQSEWGDIPVIFYIEYKKSDMNTCISYLNTQITTYNTLSTKCKIKNVFNKDKDKDILKLTIHNIEYNFTISQKDLGLYFTIISTEDTEDEDVIKTIAMCFEELFKQTYNNSFIGHNKNIIINYGEVNDLNSYIS